MAVKSVLGKRAVGAGGAGLALMAMLASAGAQAGIIFTPHLSEYARLARGSYADHTIVLTRIEDIYNADGDKIPTGTPNVASGEHIDAVSLLLRYLWVGNLLPQTPLLKDHDQIFRVIGTLGWQQGSDGLGDLSRQFGQRSGASGLGDLFLLAGIYGAEYRLGPLKANDLWTVTYKLPVGDYDERSLLNIGTNYTTIIPQFAHHQEWFGRLFFDGTFAWQFNGDNDSPAYGGLTPTEPADVRNLELNLAWKFNKRWYADIGWSRRETVGPNRYGQVTLTFTDPQPPTTACQALGIPPAQCSLVDNFTLDPVPGVREDRGVEGTLLTAGVYYTYRTSSVVNLRVAVPIAGRGGQFPMEYDVYLGPKGPLNAPIARQATTLTAVQEAASVSASPYLELRFVYLFWAP